eukprot:1307007-Rhodomonas_salina.1
MSDDWELSVHTGWKVAVRTMKINTQTGKKEKGSQMFPFEYDLGILSFNVTRGISYVVEISKPDPYQKFEYYVDDMNDSDELDSRVCVKDTTDNVVLVVVLWWK